MRLLHLTDTHLHSDPNRRIHGVDTRASLERVLHTVRKRITRHPITGILLSGDLVNDDAAAYGLLYDFFAAFKVPIYCLPGNHDEAQNLQSKLAQAPFQLPGVYKLPGWRLITLDSSVKGAAAGALSSQQLTWLAQTLHQHAIPTLVCLHHPPLALGSRWLDRIGLENGVALRNVLSNYSMVHGVVFGHAHQTSDISLSGIRYLCTPSTGAQFLPGSDNFKLDSTAEPGYRWLDLGNDGKLDTGIVRVQ